MLVIFNIVFAQCVCKYIYDHLSPLGILWHVDLCNFFTIFFISTANWGLRDSSGWFVGCFSTGHAISGNWTWTWLWHLQEPWNHIGVTLLMLVWSFGCPFFVINMLHGVVRICTVVIVTQSAPFPYYSAIQFHWSIHLCTHCSKHISCFIYVTAITPLLSCTFSLKDIIFQILNNFSLTEIKFQFCQACLAVCLPKGN